METTINEAVKNQTYDNLEIILVDDGSPDKTWQKIQEMKSKILSQNGDLSKNKEGKPPVGQRMVFEPKK